MARTLIGRQFNGTTIPLAAGALACGLAALLFVLLAEHGRLFRPHNEHVDEAAVDDTGVVVRLLNSPLVLPARLYKATRGPRYCLM